MKDSCKLFEEMVTPSHSYELIKFGRRTLLLKLLAQDLKLNYRFEGEINDFALTPASWATWSRCRRRLEPASMTEISAICTPPVRPIGK